MARSEPMVMTGLINITQDMSAAGAALRKTAGRHANYDSAALSSEYISLHGPRRGLRCRLPKASTGGGFFGSGGQCFLIGLTRSAAASLIAEYSVDPKSIAFAACINNSGNFTVYESGNPIGHFGKVKGGDLIEIRLTDEDFPKILYSVNGQTRYVSSLGTSGEARLFAKVCAYCQTPLVEELQWILEPVVAQEGEVALTGSHGIAHNPFTRGLSKMQYLPGSSFNATVRSKDAIKSIDSDHVGISFEVSPSQSGTDQIFAVGYTSDLADQLEGSSLESLDHAAHIHGTSLKVYEKGVLQGEIQHHVKAGDRIDMIIAVDEESSEPKVQYYVNRQFCCESQSKVDFPLHVKACARSRGALIENLRWVHRSEQEAPPLRHLASPASSLADNAATTMSQLETTLSQLSAAVGALQGAVAEGQAELAAEKEATSALMKEQAELRAERDALRAALNETSTASARDEGSVRSRSSEPEELSSLRATMPSENEFRLAVEGTQQSRKVSENEENQKVQYVCPSSVSESTGIANLKGQVSEEELLAVVMENFKQLSAQNAALLAVIEEKRRVPTETQQLQQRHSSEASRPLVAAKAQLEKGLKTVKAEKEQLQQWQARMEECNRHVGQFSSAKGSSQNSVAAGSRGSVQGMHPVSAAIRVHSLRRPKVMPRPMQARLRLAALKCRTLLR